MRMRWPEKLLMHLRGPVSTSATRRIRKTARVASGRNTTAQRLLNSGFSALVLCKKRGNTCTLLASSMRGGDSHCKLECATSSCLCSRKSKWRALAVKPRRPAGSNPAASDPILIRKAVPRLLRLPQIRAAHPTEAVLCLRVSFLYRLRFCLWFRCALAWRPVCSALSYLFTWLHGIGAD